MFYDLTTKGKRPRNKTNRDNVTKITKIDESKANSGETTKM